MSNQNKDVLTLDPAIEQAVLQIQMELFYHDRRIRDLRQQLREISAETGMPRFQIKVLPAPPPDDRRSAKILRMEPINKEGGGDGEQSKT
jgi:hypothetical protein